MFVSIVQLSRHLILPILPKHHLVRSVECEEFPFVVVVGCPEVDVIHAPALKGAGTDTGGLDVNGEGVEPPEGVYLVFVFTVGEAGDGDLDGLLGED